MRSNIWQKIWMVLGGVGLAFVLLEGGLRLAGFAYVTLQEHQNQSGLRQKDTIRILCVGESTTAIGGSASYPRQLEEILREGETPQGRSFVVINKGIPGTDTGRILKALPYDLDEYKPDIVVVMMGINDRYNVVSHQKVLRMPWGNTLRGLRIYNLFHLWQVRNRWGYQGWMGSQSAPDPDPDKKEHGSDYWETGLALLRSGNSAEARRFFELHLARDPEDDRGLWGLGACSFAAGEYYRAISFHERAVAINPENDWAYAGLGWCYFALQEFEKAAAMFTRAIQSNPRSEDGHNGLGWCALKKGQSQTARDMFAQTILFNRRNADAWHGIGVSLQRRGRYREAAVIFEKSLRSRGITLSNFEADVWQGEGVFLTHDGRYSEAAAALERARKIRDSTFDTRLAERNEGFDALYKLGMCYWEQDEPMKARRIFQQLLEDGHGRPDLLSAQIGWCWTREGDYVQARGMFERSLSLNPRNDTAFHGLAWMYQLSGEFARAREIFEQALALNPDTIAARKGLGLAYKELGEYERAADYFRDALQYDPEDEDLAVELAWCFVQEGEYQSAIDVFSRVDSLGEKYGDLYVMIGKNCLGKEDYEQAAAWFEDALRLDGENEQAYAGLARAQVQRGYPGLAHAAEEQAARLRQQFYRPYTRANFMRLAELAKERNIRLVVVSYPLRSVKPLTQLFGSREGIIFVDNERIFKDALARGRYKDYFTDNFAGDFGHCTFQGNRLLAENIANHIRVLFAQN